MESKRRIDPKNNENARVQQSVVDAALRQARQDLANGNLDDLGDTLRRIEREAEKLAYWVVA